MEATSQNITTSPGSSDSPQETTSQGGQGSHAGSRTDPKTANIPAQALAGIHVDVQRCAQSNWNQAPHGDSGTSRRDASEVDKLKQKLRAQSAIISGLLSKLDLLKLISTLTKSPQVKDAIGATIESAAGLDGSRKAVIGAFNEVERASRQAPAVHPSTSPASQKAILSICQEIKSSIAKQQEDISSLLTSCPLPAPTYAKALTAVTNNQSARQKASNHSTPAPRETEPEGWTRAERKKR
ncbi:hypothetical protein AGLY_006608 [Aphis glycines]|uniref:Uncharacterized protein n=1 Tax=Aphis glycines TaxID=307491 RepID=A0A6G0TTV5_APHGL|nr:hypothetical protein AGLY_006608 [Aphis glycines]